MKSTVYVQYCLDVRKLICHDLIIPAGFIEVILGKGNRRRVSDEPPRRDTLQ